MKRAAILASAPQKPCPFDAELDRLIDQRANGYLTKSEYERERNAVLRAQKRERGR